MNETRKRVVLTGAGGFVGSNLARRLTHEGHELHLLLRPGRRSWRLHGLTAGATLHDIDLDDAAATERLMANIKPDLIFHLAAHGAYPSQTEIHTMIDTNIISTFNLLGACAKTGFESFVVAGSSSEYGFKDHPPAEEEALDPNSLYAVTKASSTMLCRHVARTKDLNVAILRLYSVYGPYEEPSRLIPQLIEAGLQDRFPPLVAPDTARDFIYVADVEDAFLAAASVQQRERGAVYNVGTGVQTTIRQVVNLARDVFAITAEPHWGSMPARSWDTTTWVANSRKIRSELGWVPRHSFEDGFRQTAAWYRSRIGDVSHR